MKKAITRLMGATLLLLLSLSFGLSTAQEANAADGTITITTNKDVNSKIKLAITMEGEDAPTFEGIKADKDFEDGAEIEYIIEKQTFTIKGNLLLLYCGGNEITSITVANNPKLSLLDCANNQITTLSLASCTDLQTLNCSKNQLKGEGLDDIIASLPSRKDTKEDAGRLQIFDNRDKKETNICTKAQVAAAKAKGWIAKECTGKPETVGNWLNNYKGSDADKPAEEPTKSTIKITTAKNIDEIIKIWVEGSDITIEGVTGAVGTGEYINYTIKNQTIGMSGNITLFDCNTMGLTKVDLSQCNTLNELYVYQNELSNLSVGNNKNITWVDCSRNNISGKAMDEFITSLPDRSKEEKKGAIGLIDNTDTSNPDKNVCTKAQVEAAKNKGWIVKEYIGEQKWAEYAGSENPTPTPKTYSVTIAPTENGTIEIEGEGSDNLSAVAEGTELTVKATPNAGYKLETLTANGVDIKATGKFVVNAATTVKATFSIISSVGEIEAMGLKVFPNPAKDFVKIEGAAANAMIRLNTMDGKVLLTAKTDAEGKATIDLTGIEAGNYILQIGRQVVRLLHN